MRQFRQKLAEILIVFATALLGLATISSIGIALYSWGPLDLNFADAAWIGFALFIKMIVVGIACSVLAIIIGP